MAKDIMGQSRVPPILPREKLTRKALKAIQAYAWHKCKGTNIFPILVDYVLEAERMRRENLYAWLAQRGYSWNGAFWVDKAFLEGRP